MQCSDRFLLGPLAAPIIHDSAPNAGLQHAGLAVPRPVRYQWHAPSLLSGTSRARRRSTRLGRSMACYVSATASLTRKPGMTA